MHSSGSSSTDRRAARVAPSGLVSKTANIFADHKGAPVIECRVVDLAPGGACLELMREAAIPERFIFLHGGVRKKARLGWRKGYRFGVVF
jgi:hypothetical protein